MKKSLALICILMFGITSCNDESEDNTSNSSINTTFKFSHNWDGTAVTNADFNAIKFTNANGEQLSIIRLRYLISDIVFTTASNEQLSLSGYQLIDLNDNSTLSFSPSTTVPIGNYSNVSFTFGLNNEANAQNYTDLNSTSFNVPDMLGGGYHYMQFDGKFINASAVEQGFNYHAIRAVDNTGSNLLFPQTTFFTVNIGPVTVTPDAELEIKMNIAEWFKNPNQWNLNVLNQMLMPNTEAQLQMSENGRTVFSLGEIIP